MTARLAPAPRPRSAGHVALDWVSGKPWLLAWSAFLPFALLRAGTLAESDTFWQIRTGLLTIHDRGLPTADTFSWTVRGRSWSSNSWGFNVVLAVVYRVAGLPGVALACAAVAAAVAGLVLAVARQLGASPVVAGTLLLLAAPLLVAYLSARPQLVDYLAVLALVLLLRRIVAAPSLWLLAAVGALTVGWVNLHAGALLGVAIAGATAVLVWARPSTRVRGGWCLAALLIVAGGSLVNPHGVGLISQTAQVKSASQGVVTEWQHLDPTNPVHVIIFGLGVVALALAARRREVVFVGALCAALVGAITADRMMPILLLLSVPVLAAAASCQAALRRLHSWRIVLAPTAAVLLAFIAVSAAGAIGHIGRPDPNRYPATVVQAIPSGCRVFNSYLIGGFVVLERPDVTVSLDSRNDLYGAERVLAAKRVLAGQGDLDQALAGAGCVLVPPASGLAHRLENSHAWGLAAASDAAVLYVRR